MVMFSQVILFVGLLSVPLLTHFVNHLTAHIDHLSLNLGTVYLVSFAESNFCSILDTLAILDDIFLKTW